MVEVTGDVMTCGNTVTGKIMPQRTVLKGACVFVTNSGKTNLAQGN
jgi:hypothetical protein